MFNKIDDYLVNRVNLSIFCIETETRFSKRIIIFLALLLVFFLNSIWIMWILYSALTSPNLQSSPFIFTLIFPGFLFLVWGASTVQASASSATNQSQQVKVERKEKRHALMVMMFIALVGIPLFFLNGNEISHVAFFPAVLFFLLVVEYLFTSGSFQK